MIKIIKKIPIKDDYLAYSKRDNLVLVGDDIGEYLSLFPSEKDNLIYIEVIVIGDIEYLIDENGMLVPVLLLNKEEPSLFTGDSEDDLCMKALKNKHISDRSNVYKPSVIPKRN